MGTTLQAVTGGEQPLHRRVRGSRPLRACITSATYRPHMQGGEVVQQFRWHFQGGTVSDHVGSSVGVVRVVRTAYRGPHACASIVRPETPGPLISDVRQNGAGPLPTAMAHRVRREMGGPCDVTVEVP
jgi:hypothetical protein